MIAWRYLRARRAEGGVSVMTWISLIGITLAVFALIATMAVRAGFREEFVLRKEDRDRMDKYGRLGDNLHTEDNTGVEKLTVQYLHQPRLRQASTEVATN